MIKKFLVVFEKNLYEALEAKTSWGRNDLKSVIKTVIANTLLEILE